MRRPLLPLHRLGDEELVLAHRRSGDAAARDELVRRLLPLARRLAGKYATKSSLEDLVQVASMGLVKAMERYEPGRGPSFRSYAVPTMLGELRRHLRDHGWAVRPPRDLQERVLAVAEARDRITTDQGRSPTAQQIADDLEMTEEEVIEALVAEPGRTAASLDAPRRQDPDGDFTLGDTIGSEDAGIAGAEHDAVIEGLAEVLTERERTVLRLRFQEDMYQREIGEIIGVSQMQVSRLIRDSVAKLRLAARQGTAA